MRKVRCHQCKTVQSSARDVCIECGGFMKKDAEFMVGTIPDVPLMKKTVAEKEKAAYITSGLAADTQMICCHACYLVQLAEESVCIKCRALMQRDASFIFPARSLTRPYSGRAPKDITAEVSVIAGSVSINSTATIDNLDSRELPPQTDSKQKQMNICCHKCYTVQTASNTICGKCKTLMQREQQYIFAAK